MGHGFHSNVSHYQRVAVARPVPLSIFVELNCSGSASHRGKSATIL